MQRLTTLRVTTAELNALREGTEYPALSTEPMGWEVLRVTIHEPLPEPLTVLKPVAVRGTPTQEEHRAYWSWVSLGLSILAHALGTKIVKNNLVAVHWDKDHPEQSVWEVTCWEPVALSDDLAVLQWFLDNACQMQECGDGSLCCFTAYGQGTVAEAEDGKLETLVGKLRPLRGRPLDQVGT